MSSISLRIGIYRLRVLSRSAMNILLISISKTSPSVALRKMDQYYGNDKFSTRDAYYTETMLSSNGLYRAKVVREGGSTVIKVSWYVKPSVDNIIEGLKSALISGLIL